MTGFFQYLNRHKTEFLAVTAAVGIEIIYFRREIEAIADKLKANPFSVPLTEVTSLAVLVALPTVAGFMPLVVLTVWRGMRVYYLCQRLGIDTIFADEEIRDPRSKRARGLRQEVLQCYARSTSFRYLGIAGFEMLGGVKRHPQESNLGYLYVQIRDHPRTPSEIILMDPTDDESLRARIEEVNTGEDYLADFTIHELRHQICQTLEVIRDIKPKQTVRQIGVFLYRGRPQARLFMFDEEIIFAPYRPGRHGEETTHMKVVRGLDPFFFSWISRFYVEFQRQCNPVNPDEVLRKVSTESSSSQSEPQRAQE